MSTQECEMGGEETKSRASRFITAAEYFLRQRNFADCRDYAHRAGDSELTHKSSTQILTIASVLSAPSISSTQHDYYTILDLPYFESDTSRIKSSFETLASILHPNVNPYPHASEASFLVSEAWSVLSNPIKKAKFDDELKGSVSAGRGATFWTICPYCYYVYEYDIAYEGCCLRCCNERCRKVLHGSAIGVPPPPDVIQKGYYWCPGFMPLELRKSNGEEIGENLWVPFAIPSLLSTQSSNHEAASNGSGLAGYSSHDCKEKILRDNVMNFQADLRHGNGLRPENWGVNNEFRVKEARFENASWNSNNLGIGVFTNNDDQGCSMYGVCEEDYTNIDGINGKDSEIGILGNAVNNIDSGVEFFDGDDDLMVGFQCDFDLENGEDGLR